ncbi:MAG: putative transporter permease protein [Ilumatobacteraceae bacterium]|nr:putative transporter permease protein [Ilumatobacteraceae bacterium]
MNGANVRRNAVNVAIPVAFGAIIVVLWQQFVEWRKIKPFILPTPSSIWSEAIDKVNLLRAASLVTGRNAIVGLVLGVIVGVFAAMIANRFRILSELITPISAAISAVPIVVIVSILNNMFPLGSQVARRLMVLIIVFFVVFVNVARGLRQSDPIQVELMRSYAASEQQVMRKVRLPNAMPFLFTAIKIAAPISVTTAFVSEYFGGTQDGLGQKIASSMSSSKYPLGWAYVGAACIVGLLFFVGANLLEYVAVPWQRRRDSR